MAEKLKITLTGLDCMDCVAKLEASLGSMKGVASAKINIANAELSAEYDPRVASLPAIVRRIRDLGYDVQLGEDLVLELEGMDCADCAAKLQQAVASLPDVLDAQVVFATAQMRVRGVSPGLEEAVIARVRELGYDAHRAKIPVAGAMPVSTARDWRSYLFERRRTILTFASGAYLGAAILAHWLGASERALLPLYALAILTGGFYVARSGWAALRTTHSLDMNALMSIAAIGAMGIGDWAEGATAMFLFSFGNTLEALTMDRARRAIRKLIELAPHEATRIRGDHADRVPVGQLHVGDLIEVKPGEKVPMDGTVEQGASDVNQAPITGESLPVEVKPGSSVFAGSINGRGGMLVRVTRLAQDNTLSRIVQMVQEAQSQRAPSQRFVDAFAKYYTPTVIVLATAVAVVPPLLFRANFDSWLYRALVLLVIACPCALVISTPVAIVSAISSAARKGVLVKGGMHLENVARTCVVAFDKTGTLTEGRPAVVIVEPLKPHIIATDSVKNGADRDPDRLLVLAASVEAHSPHPIARAIVEEAQRRGLKPLPAIDFRDITGEGAQARINGQTYYVGKHMLFCERVPHAGDVCARVEQLEAEGKTMVLVGTESDVLGLIGVADRVREASARVVQALRPLGITETVMLSGDNLRVAEAIGRTVGIENIQAGLLPEDKVKAVEDLMSKHGMLAMVGDGVNDAPAMARATVGIAMGAAGSDAALETADIVLMSGDLERIPYVMRLGRRTLSIIRQNIGLSLAIKAAFLLLAVLGVATLWMAVFADMGTSLIVTLNGMRLLSD